MVEVQEFLVEPEAKELLHTFLGNVATAEELSSYDDFLGLVTDTQLPLAIGSMVEHHGMPNPRVAGQMRINGSSQGWKFSAYNQNREYYSGTTVSQSRRRFAIGPRERSLVMFHHHGIKGAMALEDTTNSHSMYLIDNANPESQDAWSKMGDVPMYLYSGYNAVPTSVTSAAIMAAEARLHAPETIRGFLDISSRLVNQLLKVTSENTRL